MKTFILIMIIGGSSNQSGFTTVTAEFYGRESCEAARQHIVKNLTRKEYTSAIIQAQGCFEKRR